MGRILFFALLAIASIFFESPTAFAKTTSSPQVNNIHVIRGGLCGVSIESSTGRISLLNALEQHFQQEIKNPGVANMLESLRRYFVNFCQSHQRPYREFPLLSPMPLHPEDRIAIDNPESWLVIQCSNDPKEAPREVREEEESVSSICRLRK